MPADGQSFALWKHVNGREGRWIVPNLAGGWMIELDPAAQGNDLRRQLPNLLRDLEAHSVREFGSGYRHRGERYRPDAERLGIAHGRQGGTDFPGSVYFTIDLPIERTGGIVASTGDALVEWANEWIIDPGRADNLRKLAASGMAERQLCLVLPDFATVPFGVLDLLTREGAPLPTVPPILPPEVTHLWVLSVWTMADGVRWSPDGGWSHFAKRFDQVDDADAPEAATL